MLQLASRPPSRWRRSIVPGLLVSVMHAGAGAFELGPVRWSTPLNAPLRAEIDVLDLTPAERGSISASFPTREELPEGVSTRVLSELGLHFEVRSAPAGGDRIVVTTSRPIRTPVLTFPIAVATPRQRTVREFSVLLDPPGHVPASGQTTPLVAAARTYGPVRAGESLWQIAIDVRPEYATRPERTMLALLAANPDAFPTSNVNDLSAGVMLRIPTTQEIARFEHAEAAGEIARQNAAWEAGRAARGGAPAATGSAGAGDSADSTDGLKLVGGGSSDSSAASAEDAAVLREELDLVRREAQAALRERDELAATLAYQEMRVQRIQNLLERQDHAVESLRDRLSTGTAQGVPDAVDESPRTTASQAGPAPRPRPAPQQPEPRPVVVPDPPEPPSPLSRILRIDRLALFRSEVSTGHGPDDLVKFPWPPLNPTSKDKIPREFLVSEGEQVTLRTVAGRLEAALASVGHSDHSYHDTVPNGFALVSQLEQIDDRGRYKEGLERFEVSFKPLTLAQFSFQAYVARLFRTEISRYRVIAFVVTDQNFGFRQARATQGQAGAWKHGGTVQVAGEVAGTMFTANHLCHALVYEFEKRAPGQQKASLDTSPLAAQLHLDNLGIMVALTSR